MNESARTVSLGGDRVPPRLGPRANRGFALLGAALLAGAGAGAILFFFDPARHHFYPVCYFHEATGLNCPGCGSLRALHALLHGHIAEAAHLNLLLLACLPFLAWSGVRTAVRALRQQPMALVVRSGLLWGFLVVAIVFTVLRNLPAFAWLSP